jgi:fucose 4-O-acetylase-like acetyltransferase
MGTGDNMEARKIGGVIKDIPERRIWIDSVKGIAILLVVLGHIIPMDNPFCIWIYSFHMPIFFILSGLLLSYRDDWKHKTIKEFVIKKMKSLLYPYFTLSAICVICGTVYKGIAEGKIALFQTLTLSGYSAMWFLPALFIAEVFFCATNKKCNRWQVLVINVITIVIATLFSFIGWREFPNKVVLHLFEIINILIRALIASVFINLGFYCRRFMEKLFDSNKFIVGLIIFVAVAINLYLCRFNTKVDLCNSIIGNPLIYWINAAIASTAIILLSKKLLDRKTVLTFFGKNSLVIMSTHLPLPIVKIGTKIIDTLFTTELYARYIMIFVLTIGIEIIVVMLVNRYFRFLINIDVAKKMCEK